MFDRGYIGKRGPKARTVVSPCGPQVERSPLIAFSHTPLPLPRGPPPYPPLLRHPARLPPPSRPSASTHTHTQRERERERERERRIQNHLSSPLPRSAPRLFFSHLSATPFPSSPLPPRSTSGLVFHLLVFSLDHHERLLPLVPE